MKARILVLPLLSAVAVGAVPAAAEASPRTTTLVRDGTYTEIKPGGPVINFKVKNRKIVSLYAYVKMICASPGTSETGERLQFIPSAPVVRIPRSGRTGASFRIDEAGRAGQIDMNVDVRNRSKIDVDITANVGGTDEACNGTSAFQTTRAVPGRRPAGAMAASRTTYVVRNGNYGVIEADGQGAGFRVRSRTIKKFNAIVTMDCRSVEFGTTSQNAFLIRADEGPASIRIGRNGKASESWDAEDGGRNATILADFDFTGRRAKVLIRLISTSPWEECSATPEFTLRRGAPFDPPRA